MEVGAFEAYTRGFGSKMLKKWGWKAGKGLGRNEDGIHEPVQVRKRPTGSGLGPSDLEPETKKRLLPEHDTVSSHPGFAGAQLGRHSGLLTNELYHPFAPASTQTQSSQQQVQQHNQRLHQLQGRSPRSPLVLDDEEAVDLKSPVALQERYLRATEEEKLKEFASAALDDCRTRRAEVDNKYSLWGNTNEEGYAKFVATFSDLEDERAEYSETDLKRGLQTVHEALDTARDLTAVWHSLDQLDRFRALYGNKAFRDCGLDLLSFVIALPSICHAVTSWTVNFEEPRHRQYDLDRQMRFVSNSRAYLKPLVTFQTSVLWSYINETVYLDRICRIVEQGWHVGVNDAATVDVFYKWIPLVNLDSFLDNIVTPRLLDYVKKLPWKNLFPSQYRVIDLDETEEQSHEPEDGQDLKAINLEPLLPWFDISDYNSQPLIWALFERIYKEAKKYPGCQVKSEEFRAGICHFRDVPELFEELVKSLVLNKLTDYVKNLEGFVKGILKKSSGSASSDSFVIIDDSEIEEMKEFEEDAVMEVVEEPKAEENIEGEADTLDAEARSKLEAVLKWQEVVRDSELIDFLEDYFFAAWLNLFARWMTRWPNDAPRFYRRWKKLFVDYELLYPPVIACFDRALHMMRVEMELEKTKFGVESEATEKTGK